MTRPSSPTPRPPTKARLTHPNPGDAGSAAVASAIASVQAVIFGAYDRDHSDPIIMVCDGLTPVGAKLIVAATPHAQIAAVVPLFVAAITEERLMALFQPDFAALIRKMLATLPRGSVRVVLGVFGVAVSSHWLARFTPPASGVGQA